MEYEDGLFYSGLWNKLRGLPSKQGIVEDRLQFGCPTQID